MDKFSNYFKVSVILAAIFSVFLTMNTNFADGPMSVPEYKSWGLIMFLASLLAFLFYAMILYFIVKFVKKNGKNEKKKEKEREQENARRYENTVWSVTIKVEPILAEK